MYIYTLIGIYRCLVVLVSLEFAKFRIAKDKAQDKRFSNMYASSLIPLGDITLWKKLRIYTKFMNYERKETYFNISRVAQPLFLGVGNFSI